MALAADRRGGLVFQTTTQSLMLSLSDTEYHGRMQSMVVLGFSGFGLAALPLGALADAVTLELTLALMGVVGHRRDRGVHPHARASTAGSSSPSNWPERQRQAVHSTPGNVATQCSAMRPSSMRWTMSQVTTDRSPVSLLMPLLVARVQTLSPSTTRSSIGGLHP